MSNSRNEDKDNNRQLSRSHGELSRMMKQGRSFSGLERHCGFLNTGAFPAADNRFATISAASGIDYPDDGRGLVPVDWDQDGDLDLWITARNAPRVRFLRNNSRTDNHFLAFKLSGNGSDTSRDAIGARVEVVTLPQDGAYRNIKSLRAGEGFLSQEPKWIHFGLEKNLQIDHVLVHWPGGEKEKFNGVKPDNRYSLVQGSGIASLLPARGSLDLKVSTPIIPAPSQQTRIPLLTRLPKTTLVYRGFDQRNEQMTTGLGKATLVTLWASWCPTCKLELAEFTEQEEAINKAGLNIIALSVDGLGDDKSNPDQAQKLVKEIGFPFTTGLASPRLIKELQELHDLVIPLKHPLPVPTSFLIDDEGRVSVIYKGQAHLDDVLKDVQRGKQTPAENFKYAAPMKGRTIDDPIIDRVFQENQARALFYYGTLLLDRKQADEAILFFLDVLTLKPESYKTHFNLGLAYKSRNNLEAAFYHFNEAMIANPDFVETHQMLGELYLNRGMLANAREQYLHYLEAYPDNPQTLSSLGVIAANQRDFDKAVQLFSEAIALAPDLVEPKYNLGAMLLAQGKNDESEQLFLTLLKSRPDYPDINFNLGVILENREEPDKALTYYLQELKIRPNSVKTLTAMGYLMEKKDNYHQANRYFSRAISIHPNYTPALEGQARMRLSR